MAAPVGDVRQWPQGAVSNWLHQCGLEQYAQLFVDNDIDGEALVLMDDAVLRDLGITSIGHRVTLLSEIHRLKEANGIPIEPGDWIPQGTYAAMSS
ncbi:hypothetical protein ACI68E_000513 [Malassezia pachydermatis]